MVSYRILLVRLCYTIGLGIVWLAIDGLATTTFVSAPEWNAGGHRSVHSTAVAV